MKIDDESYFIINYPSRQPLSRHHGFYFAANSQNIHNHGTLLERFLSFSGMGGVYNRPVKPQRAENA